MKLKSILAAGLLLPVFTASAETDGPAPKVQLAMLLDTSGSMQGLIHQARAQLWKIVNEFNTAKRGGRTPEVEVALFEYGNDSINPENNWVRQVSPLTRDLDEVSRKLFALSTNGGSEYCGAVIRSAAQTLNWSREPGVYRAMFVAGNEPFTQGPVSPVDACRAATEKGIVVNTIHCGPDQEGINGGWQMGARLAEGSYLCIDQNKAIAHIPCPQDDELVRLGTELNKTYLGYGRGWQAACANQAAQDSNAASIAPSAQISRAVTKASMNYCNTAWDLVDAVTRDGLKPETVKKDELPKELQALNEADLKAHIAKMAAERTALQEKIRILNEARGAHLASQQKGAGGAQTLDTAISKTVREQAAKQDFKWEK